MPKFGVNASPFNGIKLELGIILIVGVLIMLLIHFRVENIITQIVCLSAYGLAGMVWLLLRTRVILIRIQESSNKG